MNIIAKMNCESVNPQTGGLVSSPVICETVTLRAVYGDSEENKSFSEATPSAIVQMTISNKAAFGAFVEGKSYYVRFEEAPVA